MTFPEYKECRRQHRLRLRELFMESWDPIGVRGVPEATDEYDSYIAKAYAMVIDEGASAVDVSAYLQRVVSRSMSLGDSFGDECRRTAVALLALVPEFKRGLATFYNQADVRQTKGV